MPLKKGSAEAKAWGEKMRRARAAKGHRGGKRGDKSKTHKGDEDYTTKKGDKDYHPKRRNVKAKGGRRPYTLAHGGGRGQGLVH